MILARLLVQSATTGRFLCPSLEDGQPVWVVSLREAGVSSTSLVSLLVAMEDAFGFEWQDDVRPEALRSISSLAQHVVAVRG